MSQIKFKILVWAGDDHLSQEVARNIRRHFVDLPMEMTFENLLRRVVSEYKAMLPDLLVLAVGSQNADVPDLLLQLQAISGGAKVIYLGTQELGSEFDEVDRIELPLVRWETFLDRVLSAVPDYLAQKYSLVRLETPAKKVLRVYAKKFEAIHGESQSHPSGIDEGIVLAPYQGSSVSSQERIIPPVKISVDAHGLGNPRVSVPESRIEWGVLIGVLSLTGWSYWRADIENPDPWISIKTLLTILSCVSVFGFFVGRRFIKKNSALS